MPHGPFPRTGEHIDFHSENKLKIFQFLVIFSCMLRDSTTHFVGPSVAPAQMIK